MPLLLAVPDLPFILAIEISNPSSGESAVADRSGVAIGRLREGTVEQPSFEPVRMTGRGSGGDDLMPAIDRLSRRAGLRPRSGPLVRVAVSIGPGGYTSVRIACAAGKMIAEAFGARCVGVPSAAVAVESLDGAARAGIVAVALASKGDSAWVQAFDAGQPLAEGRLMTAADVPRLAETRVRLLLADTFLPAPIRAAALAAGLEIREPVLDGAACARLGARLPTIDPQELVPLYPREPDAVTLWRAKKA